MSIVFTGKGDAANLTGTATPTYTGFTVAAAEGVVIAVTCGSGQTTTGVSDGPNTYLQVGTAATDSSDGFKFSIWYCPNVTSVTSGTLTVTNNTSGGNNAVIWARYTGLDLSALGQAAPAYNRNVGPGTGMDAVTSASITATTPLACLVGFAINLQGGPTAAGTGFTDDGNFANLPSSGFDWQGRIQHQAITDTSGHFSTNTLTGGTNNVVSLAVMLAQPAAAAVLVQSKAAQSAGALSNVSVTFDNPITPGNTILAHGTCRDATTGANTYTVTDSINAGAYVVDASNGGGGNYFLAITRKSSAASGTPTVTMTATGATPAGHLSIVVQEWSGLAPTSPLDQAVNNFNSVLNNSPTSGTTPTLTQSREVMVSCAVEVSSTTWTPGSGFTMDPTTINGLGGFFAVEYIALPTTAGAAATYSIGTTTLWQAVASTYRSATPNLGGQSANFSQGSPSRSLTAPLTARTITSTAGTISRAVTKSLTGQTATFGEGSIFNAVTLSGQTATFSAPGTITKFISGPVTTAISGLSASFGQGTLTLSVGYLLDSNFVIMVGQTANFGMGAITATVTPVITGRTATFTEGSLNAGVVSGPSYTLVGRTATFSPGNISAILPGSVTTQLSGQTATFTEGVPIFAPSYALGASTITSSEGVITFSTSNNIAFLLGSQTASFTNGLIVQAFPGGMPNVVGYLVQEATLILEQSGVLQPKKLNYFSTYPITYHWVRSKQRPSTVLAQSVPVGMTYTVNMPITLTLSEFPFSVSPGR